MATSSSLASLLSILVTVNLGSSRTFWEGFIGNKENSLGEAGHRDQVEATTTSRRPRPLDYSSPGSAYGLIDAVLGTDRRRARHYGSGGRGRGRGRGEEDVWLEEGSLLVLRGGVLDTEPPTTTTRRPWTPSSSSSVFQPSVRVVTSNMFNRVTVLRLRDRGRGGQQQEVRRSDRHPGADTSVNTRLASDGVNTRLADNDRAASRDNRGWLGLGVQLHCFIC